MPKRPPKQFGPDEKGRWGNVAMRLRDKAGDKNIAIYRECNRVIAAVQRGEYTRVGLLQALYEMRDDSLQAILAMQQAGAPIDVDALECPLPRISLEKDYDLRTKT